MSSRLYVGEVMHARLSPVQHAFRYPAFAFAVDVDELADLDRRLRLFGHDRRGLFSLRDSDYLGTEDGDLRVKLRRHIERAGAEISLHRIELVTAPRVAGHAFNPVSFYYCHDAAGDLSGIVTEVNNTFGEGHVYVLPAADAVDDDGDRLRFVARRRFHVSPFNDMRGEYEFHFRRLGEQLDVRIDIRRAGDRAFVSRLSGTERALDDAALWRLAVTYPLTVALTLPRIMWQAYKLHYRKRLPVHNKPEPSSRQTFTAANPPYISEFSAPGWLQRRTSTTATRDNHGSH